MAPPSCFRSCCCSSSKSRCLAVHNKKIHCTWFEKTEVFPQGLLFTRIRCAPDLSLNPLAELPLEQGDCSSCALPNSSGGPFFFNSDYDRKTSVPSLAGYSLVSLEIRSPQVTNHRSPLSTFGASLLLYHLLMETLLVEAFGPLAVALILYVAISGARRFVHQVRNRLSPEQLQAARDSYRNRLVHPHAEEVEQGIGALLPQRLLTLYDDHQTILSEQLEIRRLDINRADTAAQENSSGLKHAAEWIEAFLPLDLESQKYTVDLATFGCGKGFCFATDGCGNFYWTPVSDTREPDAPVFYACHDPVGNEQVAASLDEFLSWPRTMHAPEAEVTA